MYPWIWNWSPHVDLPLGGDVAQKISPSINWFFDGIEPSAGNAKVERRAFDVASYGRQLGLITEVLLDIGNKQGPLSPAAQTSLKRLDDIRARIDSIKEQEVAAIGTDIEDSLTKLKQQRNGDYQQLRLKLLQFLGN